MKTIVNTVEEMIPGFGTKLNENLAEQNLPALQEAMARIKTLESEVAALKE